MIPKITFAPGTYGSAQKDADPVEKGKRRLVREIYRSSAMAADWTFPEDFQRGGEFGFVAEDCRVTAVADFDSRAMKVRMTSPISCTSTRKYFYRPPFRGKPYGHPLIANMAATPYALSAAKSMLSGLYADYRIVDGYRDSLPGELVKLDEKKQAFAERWRKQNAELLDRYSLLCRTSGEIKRRLKNKEITEQEYKTLRAPVHDEIASIVPKLEDCCAMPDYFIPIYWGVQEISDIWKTLYDNYGKI